MTENKNQNPIDEKNIAYWAAVRSGMVNRESDGAVVFEKFWNLYEAGLAEKREKSSKNLFGMVKKDAKQKEKYSDHNASNSNTILFYLLALVQGLYLGFLLSRL